MHPLMHLLRDFSKWFYIGHYGQCDLENQLLHLRGDVIVSVKIYFDWLDIA